MTTPRGGAPRGNQNARKHGYYASDGPLRGPSYWNCPDPDAELARLSAAIARLAESSSRLADPSDYEAALSAHILAILKLVRFKAAAASCSGPLSPLGPSSSGQS